MAAAAPVWLECSGGDKRFREGRTVSRTILVMFDDQSRSVLVKEAYDLHAEKVQITPTLVEGSNPLFRIGVDRNTAAFNYFRFADGVNISLMSGTCQRAPNPPQQKF